ncbi:MAG: folylpolyglutamate synthase/dihydrofolate synthase family protein [bacterium]
MHRSYKQAVEWLNRFSNYEKNSHTLKPAFSLRGIKILTNRLSNPQRSFKSIHVAGTVGKGSVCAILASVIQAAGFRTGLYTSPHLMDFRERIRINGRMISRKEFVEGAEELRKAAREGQSEYTYFEILTALAMWHFRRCGVEYAVVETGLGGRLDATRIVKPETAVITPIGHDHMQVLGRTLPAIAAEKAGIIPYNGIVVTAQQRPLAMKVLKNISKRRRARLVQVENEVNCNVIKSATDGIYIKVTGLFDGELNKLFLPLAGEFQAQNAAIALTTIKMMMRAGFSLTPKYVHDGFSAVRFGGRMEFHKLGRHGLLLIDGAHNPSGAGALAAALRKIPHRRLIIVVGMMKDKDLRGVLRILSDAADEIVPVSLSFSRAFTAGEILQVAEQKHKIKFCADNMGEALNYVLRCSGRSSRRADIVCVTGSLYAVGEVYKYLGTDLHRLH